MTPIVNYLRNRIFRIAPALIAIVVYVLLAGLLVKLVAFTMGNTRNGTYSSTSSRIDSL